MKKSVLVVFVAFMLMELATAQATWDSGAADKLWIEVHGVKGKRHLLNEATSSSLGRKVNVGGSTSSDTKDEAAAAETKEQNPIPGFGSNTGIDTHHYYPYQDHQPTPRHNN